MVDPVQKMFKLNYLFLYHLLHAWKRQGNSRGFQLIPAEILHNDSLEIVSKCLNTLFSKTKVPESSESESPLLVPYVSGAHEDPRHLRALNHHHYHDHHQHHNHLHPPRGESKHLHPVFMAYYSSILRKRRKDIENI